MSDNFNNIIKQSRDKISSKPFSEMEIEAGEMARKFRKKGRKNDDVYFTCFYLLLKTKIYTALNSSNTKELRGLLTIYETMREYKVKHYKKYSYKTYSLILREISDAIDIKREIMTMPPKNLFFQHLLLKIHLSDTLNKKIYEMYESVMKFSELKSISTKHVLSALIDIVSVKEKINLLQSEVLRIIGSDSTSLLKTKDLIIEKLNLDAYIKQKRYDPEELKNWKSLYEALGSFRAVEKEIKKKTGKGPSVNTIITRLEEFHGEDFKKWEVKHAKYPKYIEKENLQEQEITYLSDFFKPTEFGNISGTCVVCGRNTTRGKKIDFSSNFTNWELLQDGNCICPNCYELTRNQDYRRKMWVATKDGIRFFKKKEMLSILLEPPVPPFSIYLTKTYQKQGFFLLISKVNYSREDFFVAYDMEIIHVKCSMLKRMVDLALDLRAKKVTKMELRTGKFHVHRLKEIAFELIQEINQKYIKNPTWELVIDAIK